MDTRPWKRERIIELPHSQRSRKPIIVDAQGRYCSTCGALHTTLDAFCGNCGAFLQHDHSNEYTTLPFRLTGASRF